MIVAGVTRRYGSRFRRRRLGYDAPMTDQTPEPTTASDMSAGGDKQGNDYGSPGATSEQEGAPPGGSGDSSGDSPGDSSGGTPWAGASDDPGGGSDPGGVEADLGGGAGGSDLNEGAGGSDPNGPAVPDEQDAAAAQGGVQEAFAVTPQD